jgi:hypothetical protein
MALMLQQLVYYVIERNCLLVSGVRFQVSEELPTLMTPQT